MTAYIGMGANLGDPRGNLTKALVLLNESFRVEKKSSLYRTAPVGGPPNQPDCYNAVVQIQTTGAPADTLNQLREIEQRMGRTRAQKWEPRIIDLDLLDQDGQILDEKVIVIPHPMLHLRAFVLAPLGEIAPGWKHPALKLTPAEMMEKLSPEDKSVILEVEDWP